MIFLKDLFQKKIKIVYYISFDIYKLKRCKGKLKQKLRANGCRFALRTKKTLLIANSKLELSLASLKKNYLVSINIFIKGQN